MKKRLLMALLPGIVFSGYCQQTSWGVKFCDAIIERYQPSIDVMTNKGWDHSNSIILHGIEKIYTKTNNPAYLKYIKAFVDSFVAGDGSITGMKAELDGIHPGLLCLFLYEETGEEKYKIAATNMRNYLIGTANSPSVFNKTPDGGYWHKNNDHYEQVMTVDGAYMAHPFLVRYGKMFNDTESMEVAAFQTLLVASHSFNKETRLPYHGWDYTKTKSWANPITGTSSEVWSRSVGWYAMALVDILEYLPATNKEYKPILDLFQQLATGIKNAQNESDELWYQVIDKPEVTGNYPETSGSGMIVYALQKGVNYGWLDTSYGKIASTGWAALQEYITTYSDGQPQITSFNPGMGIQDNLEDYIAVRPVTSPSTDVKQHPHGYCAILMAAYVMEK